MCRLGTVLSGMCRNPAEGSAHSCEVKFGGSGHHAADEDGKGESTQSKLMRKNGRRTAAALPHDNLRDHDTSAWRRSSWNSELSEGKLERMWLLFYMSITTKEHQYPIDDSVMTVQRTVWGLEHLDDVIEQ